MPNDAPIQVLSVVSDREKQLALRSCLDKYSGIALSEEALTESEALQRLRNKHIDVVLLDLSAHDFDGNELTRRIRESNPSVRILITTARNNAEDIFMAMDAGADGYVLHGNHTGLETAIRSVKLGTVWLDPGIAAQVLDVMADASRNDSTTRTLPTGLFVMPLMPDEKSLLQDLAASDCVDGVCMVNPDFVKNLRRFGPQQDDR